ncbi:glycosyltransferase family protein [Chryseobacterium chendengshani]|uniref:glycosyltransferase n=1 Tax=Chryseobacterium sp. LJ756 TaxID=2864113 RepID=UPI001C63F83E|nr:glycosyltransferase [Chryseobacterium sp. LJ756]MBW7676636.1 glycosyltransferase [Chryseobacterium sp. LJ756]
MKILLFGEYSNVHWTLAEAYRKLGHEVLVVSDGDWWKNYQRDINIPYHNKFKFAVFLLRIIFDKRFKNNDIVQLISYRFLFKNKLGSLNKFFFNFLKKNNKKIIMSAFGDDYYYVQACLQKKLEYNPIKEIDNNLDYVKDVFSVHYSETAKNLNKYVASQSDGIVACMYDYFVSYQDDYKNKLVAIPLPVDIEKIKYRDNLYAEKLKIFLGVQKFRIEWKGTDYILKCLEIVKEKHKDSIDVHIVENVPYDEYVSLFSESNLFFDQTHSYAQGMNGLIAMAQGKILFGGGEYKHYELLGEKTNFPIVNITSDIQDMYNKIEYFIDKKNHVLELGKQSRQYIEDHHDSLKIGQDYINYYERILKSK